MKLLIIEDEPDLLLEIKNYLSQEEYLCESATDYNKAQEKLELYQYDIAIVDLTLPYGSGLDLIKRLKQIHPETGIIIISAKDSLDDKLTGLELGADDYLTKPFHLSELNARVKSLIRRRKFDGSNSIHFNEIEVLPNDNAIIIGHIKVSLTRKEHELLLFFIANRERLITRESIAEHLWGDQIDLADNFDFIYTHINNLRKKITRNGGGDYIQTVYGMGYKLTQL